jgi:hypothetical protein
MSPFVLLFSLSFYSLLFQRKNLLINRFALSILFYRILFTNTAPFAIALFVDLSIAQEQLQRVIEYVWLE